MNKESWREVFVSLSGLIHGRGFAFLGALGFAARLSGWAAGCAGLGGSNFRGFIVIFGVGYCLYPWCSLYKACFILFFVLIGGAALAQRGSIDVVPQDSMRDSFPPLPPTAFHFQDVGVSWTNGAVQFFQGYDARILYADAQSGLPIYPDWGLYSRSTVFPTFFQVGAHASVVDTVRGLKLRFSANYSRRSDTMDYGSDFVVNDTVYGRLASEKGSFGSVAVAGLKQSRKVLGFVRFHGGAELELGLSPTSRISFIEYSFDFGDERIVDYNEFRANGKPRFTGYATAILGMETVFFKHFGFTAEVKSGLGAQLVVKEKAFGMGRTTYHLALNYYIFDYKRKPLPKPIRVPILREEGGIQQPPVPGF